MPPFSWPIGQPAQTWLQASGCETGQIWPTPDGKIVCGACKGEFGRYNVETGQEKHYWVYPQKRYGKNPEDMRFRFPRQAPIEVVAARPERSSTTARSTAPDDRRGRSLDAFSPDLTANGPEGHVTSGEPITRDVTGEEVYSALYAMSESRLERGVIWIGANDGPVSVTRDNGKTWKNVTPKDLPPAAACRRSKTRRIAAARRTSRSTGCA